MEVPQPTPTEVDTLSGALDSLPPRLECQATDEKEASLPYACNLLNFPTDWTWMAVLHFFFYWKYVMFTHIHTHTHRMSDSSCSPHTFCQPTPSNWGGHPDRRPGLVASWNSQATDEKNASLPYTYQQTHMHTHVHTCAHVIYYVQAPLCFSYKMCVCVCI